MSDLTLRSYGEGDVILNRGRSVQSWHYVISGYVAASIQLDTGKCLPINMHGRDAWFGEQALLNKQPSYFDYTCLTSVEVVTISKKCFDAAVLDEPDFVRFLALLVARQSRLHSEMLTLMRMGNPALRVFMGLAQFAEASCQNSKQINVSQLTQMVDIPIAQNQIAELCGLSRTLFSQYIQHLARNGWLKLRYGGIELQSAATWCIFARKQRERQCVTSEPTIQTLLNDMAAAHEELGPYQYPNLINKRMLSVQMTGMRTG
jgi:CRP/FNR family cyclic AMP-dependent transcriptional regulator